MTEILDLTAAGIQGCCHGKNFYNLGGAHSKRRAKSVESFGNRLISLGLSQINIAVTNTSQSTERKYLEACGFTQVYHKGSLWLHAGNYTDVYNATKPLREARQKQLEEERQKRIEQDRIRREAIAETQRRAELGTSLEKRATVADIRQLLAYHNTISSWSGRNEKTLDSATTRENIKKHYGFEDFPHWYTLWYEDHNLARAVNYRLRRAGRIL